MAALDTAKKLYSFDGDTSAWDNATIPALTRLKQLIGVTNYSNYLATGDSIIELGHAWLIVYYLTFTDHLIKHKNIAYQTESYGQGDIRSVMDDIIKLRNEIEQEAIATLQPYINTNDTGNVENSNKFVLFNVG